MPDTLENKISNLREQVTQLGKEVAVLHTTTQFPEWICFGIGISTLKGVPYEQEFWVDQMEPGVRASSED